MRLGENTDGIEGRNARRRGRLISPFLISEDEEQDIPAKRGQNTSKSFSTPHHDHLDNPPKSLFTASKSIAKQSMKPPALPPRFPLPKKVIPSTTQSIRQPYPPKSVPHAAILHSMKPLETRPIQVPMKRPLSSATQGNSYDSRRIKMDSFAARARLTSETELGILDSSEGGPLGGRVVPNSQIRVIDHAPLFIPKRSRVDSLSDLSVRLPSFSPTGSGLT